MSKIRLSKKQNKQTQLYNFPKRRIKIDVTLIGSWYIIFPWNFRSLFIIFNRFCVLVPPTVSGPSHSTTGNYTQFKKLLHSLYYISIMQFNLECQLFHVKSWVFGVFFHFFSGYLFEILYFVSVQTWQIVHIPQCKSVTS